MAAASVSFPQCALSLLLAIVLRAMVSTRRVDYNGEDDYNGRATTWEPLLNPQSSQASGSTKVDSRGTSSDIWSSRIRDKNKLRVLNCTASQLISTPPILTMYLGHEKQERERSGLCFQIV